MLLSIVMMMKNESEFLEKTLESLKKINEHINTELVIMDTGSDDNSIEIAKKYTDKVYLEKWNGHFSDMRNKSISYAKGDWILILDADEVLIDCNELVNFFKSDMHKKYNSATIKLKNLYKSDKSVYGYGSILRLFKNDNIKYIGRIHEQPTHKDPVYNDIAEFEHYGYIFEDDEKRNKKLKRNENLLLKELEENPNDPYARFQLCQNLIAEGKFKQARVQGEQSYKLYKKNKMRPIYIYEKLATLYINLGEFVECERLCKEYILKDKNNIDIYYLLGITQLKLYKYNESINSFKRYLYLVENYDITTQANEFESDCNTISFKEDSLLKILFLHSELKQYEMVIDTFRYITEEDKKSQSYNYFINALVKLDKYSELLKYESDINNSSTDRNNFLNSIECFLSQSDDKTKTSLYEVLSNIDGDYGVLNKIRMSKEIDLETAMNLFMSNERESFYGSILNIVIKNNIDLYELFKDIDTVWVYKYFYYILNTNKDVSIYLYDYIMNSLISFDIEKIRIYKIVSELLVTKSGLSIEKYKNMMYLYTMYSYQYLKMIHNDLSDDLLMKYLGDVDRFTIRFRQVLEFENKNSIEYIMQLKNIIKQYPQYKKIIKILIEESQESLNKGPEFEELRKLFIYNIKNMVESNNINEAKKMLNEYLINFNEDKEILNIKGVIEIMEGNLNSANITLKKALSVDINNEDLIYNINYLNEILIANKK